MSREKRLAVCEDIVGLLVAGDNPKRFWVVDPETPGRPTMAEAIAHRDKYPDTIILRIDRIDQEPKRHGRVPHPEPIIEKRLTFPLTPATTPAAEPIEPEPIPRSKPRATSFQNAVNRWANQK